MGDCLSGCPSGRNSVFGGSSCIWIIIILLFCGGCGNNGSFGSGCGDNNDCSCIIWILLILCLCGGSCGNNNSCGCGCGC
ncbi:MAG: chorion class high-cysteine HCB protein 13 [Lachnospiraceae bacterium]|nr:chorion class high-cysteine HCB protein 13 [Lachnospiraceae bacterium]